MANAEVIDARGGLPSTVLKELRRAVRIVLGAKDEQTAVLQFAIQETESKSGGPVIERIRDLLIRRTGHSGPDEPQVILDLAQPGMAAAWKRFVGLLRTGDVLTLDCLWGQPARLRMGGSRGLYASLNVVQEPAQHPSPRRPALGLRESETQSKPTERPESQGDLAFPARVLGTPSHRFDAFTERARSVLLLAEQEARQLNHNYVGTEHLLLGMLREGECVAAQALMNLGVVLDAVRRSIELVIGRGDRRVVGDIGLTPRTKKVFELAVDEARRLNHHYVGPEHLLLGLVRDGEGIGAGVIESLGIVLDDVRDQVFYVLNQSATHALAKVERARSSVGERTSSAIEPRTEPRQVARRARFSKELRRAFIAAVDESRRHQHRHIGVEHLLLGLALAEEGTAALAMTKAAVDPRQVRGTIEGRFEQEGGLEGEAEGLTSGTKEVLELAVRAQHHTQQQYLWTLHLLLGLLAAEESKSLLRSLDLPGDAVRGALEGLWGRSRLQLPDPEGPAQP